MERLTCNEQYYQCAECGEIHAVRIDKAVDLCDCTYYAVYCPVCRDVVKHLCVGQNESDIYLLYDNNLDKRLY